jgi:hypothetical protein
MIFDERGKGWQAARMAGREARLEGEPVESNPYNPYGTKREAALFVCWQRGWMEADREMVALGQAPEEAVPSNTFQKLLIL